MRHLFPKSIVVALAALCALAMGCGTTKWSDSPRTATEQLLVSDSVDRAVSEIDFSALSDQAVYLDTRYIVTALDQNYVVSTLRQHMLASGLIIKDKPEDATYVLEVRSGSLGTNRQDLLFGVPATNLPTVGMLPMGSAAIPEIALMKRTNQAAVCKIAVFAYDRMSGRPVWQSGNRKVASRAKDSWFMGAGPFQKGAIYDGTSFAGEKLSVPLFRGKRQPMPQASVSVERTFPHQASQIAEATKAPTDVENAGYLSAVPPTAPNQAAPAVNPLPPAPDAAKATPVKPSYTPPLPSAPPPQPVTAGPQGNLPPQSVTTPVNPAAATAGAIQTYNWAKEMLHTDAE